MTRRAVPVPALLVLALAACRHAGGVVEDTHTDGDTDPDTNADTHTDTGPPLAVRNVIVVLADDQPAGTLWAMPVTSERLLPEAVSFERAYVTVPMCCPMRASLLSGGFYPRDTGMLTNSDPLGGAAVFVDRSTLATRLQEAGIRTGLVGKYFNEYELGLAPYVPPGWDTWVASGTGDGAYEQSIVVGSSGPDGPAVGTETDTGGEHLTSYFFREALAFVDAHPDEPFFLYVAPNSPHLSGSPATEDLGLYADYSPRTAAWNEEDVSDKPSWLQEEPRIGDAAALQLDENARLMLRNLASLDREMAAFVDALAARGVLDDTLLIYSSDNGYLNGEHRLDQKALPYEEAVRVPLLVRAPGVAGRTDSRLVAVNLDVSATVAEAFGLPHEGEGMPLGAALADPALPTRDHVYLDNYTPGYPVWAGVVTERFKYVEWSTGDVELYDLQADPAEMESLHDAPPAGADVTAWRAWVDEHRGMAITTRSIPNAEVGVPYHAQLEHWGGVDPVIFSADSPLPDGLTIGGGGLLQGTPTTPGDYVFAVWARDASASPWNGRVQAFNRALRMSVGEPAARATTARTSPTTAKIRLHARPGVRVHLVATQERVAPEGMRRETAPVVAGADGTVELTLTDLVPGRRWFWHAYFDGVPGESGEIPKDPSP